MKSTNIKSLIFYIKDITKGYHLSILYIIFVTIYDAFYAAISPYFIKKIIDIVSNNSIKENIYSKVASTISLMILCIIFTEIIWRTYQFIINVRMIPNIKKKIIEKNSSKILHQSYQFFQNNFPGRLAHNITKLSQTIPEIIDFAFNKLLAIILTLTFAITVLSKVNIKFGIFMFVSSFLFILVALIFNKPIINQSNKWSKIKSEVSGRLVDILSNYLTINLFYSYKFEEKIISKKQEESKKNERRLQILFFIMISMLSTIYIVFQFISIIYLIKERELGNITVGDFALVLGLNTSVFHSLWHKILNISNLSKIIGESIQALQALNTPYKVKEVFSPKVLKIDQGKIDFNNVYFEYKKNQPILKNFNLTIQPNEKIGIIGYSGSGKSTIIKLLLRLYDIQKGKITIDNQDIKKVTFSSLRNPISFIPQDLSLFHRSIKENLAYNIENPSDTKILSAAKSAHAEKFIKNLPEQLDTLVGERGVKISGGQRQRISIARHFLKNSKILIFDEATSALDSITETFIQDSIEKIMKNKTTIIIAHRLTTLKKMDRIIVLDQGKIVESGKHTTLLKNKGLYKKMWDTQMEGFLYDKNQY